MKMAKNIVVAVFVMVPGMVSAEAYDIDPLHTLITFELDYVGFSNSLGWFGEVTGTIEYDAEDVTQSSVTATIAATSVNINHEARDGWILSDKVLNAAVNPTIEFVSTSIEKSSPTTGVIIGDLTMNGQALPVALDATFRKLAENPINKKQTLGISATGTLMRSDWGVTAFVGPLGDEVSVQIELEAIKAE